MPAVDVVITAVTGIAFVTALTNPMIIVADGITIDSVTGIGLVVALSGTIGMLFRLLIASKEKETALALAQKDAALANEASMKKSYQEIAAEAIKSATETANYYRQKEGRAPIIMTAPVIPESHSPSTPLQRETAMIQTMRASMAAIKLQSGQVPRPEPPKADDIGKAIGERTMEEISTPGIAKPPSSDPMQVVTTVLDAAKGASNAAEEASKTATKTVEAAANVLDAISEKETEKDK